MQLCRETAGREVLAGAAGGGGALELPGEYESGAAGTGERGGVGPVPQAGGGLRAGVAQSGGAIGPPGRGDAGDVEALPLRRPAVDAGAQLHRGEVHSGSGLVRRGDESGDDVGMRFHPRG